MVEKGTLESIKEGGIAGAGFGLFIAASRLFLFGKASDVTGNQIVKTASEARAALKSPTATASTQSINAIIFQKSVLPQLVKSTTGFAGVGALFLGTETLLRNSRDKDDHWNSIIAGAVAGSPLGIYRSGKFFVSAGASATMAAAMTIAYMLNYSIASTDKDYYKKRVRFVLGEDEQ